MTTRRGEFYKFFRDREVFPVATATATPQELAQLSAPKTPRGLDNDDAAAMTRERVDLERALQTLDARLTVVDVVHSECSDDFILNDAAFALRPQIQELLGVRGAQYSMQVQQQKVAVQGWPKHTAPKRTVVAVRRMALVRARHPLPLYAAGKLALLALILYALYFLYKLYWQ